MTQEPYISGVALRFAKYGTYFVAEIVATECTPPSDRHSTGKIRVLRVMDSLCSRKAVNEAKRLSQSCPIMPSTVLTLLQLEINQYGGNTAGSMKTLCAKADELDRVYSATQHIRHADIAAFYAEAAQ